MKDSAKITKLLHKSDRKDQKWKRSIEIDWAHNYTFNTTFSLCGVYKAVH